MYFLQIRWYFCIAIFHKNAMDKLFHLDKWAEFQAACWAASGAPYYYTYLLFSIIVQSKVCAAGVKEKLLVFSRSIVLLFRMLLVSWCHSVESQSFRKRDSWFKKQKNAKFEKKPKTFCANLNWKPGWTPVLLRSEKSWIKSKVFELTMGTEDCPIQGKFVLASEGQTSCSGPLTGLKTHYVAGVAKTLLEVDILLLWDMLLL